MRYGFVLPYPDVHAVPSATWWIEGMWGTADGSAASRERIDRRIAQGPPRV